jgi:hypothetical protein
MLGRWLYLLCLSSKPLLCRYTASDSLYLHPLFSHYYPLIFTVYLLWMGPFSLCRGQLKCDGTRAETRFRLSTKRTSLFKSVGASVQSTTGSRGVRISGSNGNNVRYTMFRGSVKGTGYQLRSPGSPSLPLECVNVCHHISTGVYFLFSNSRSYDGRQCSISGVLL